jgi:hypothetical protein
MSPAPKATLRLEPRTLALLLATAAAILFLLVKAFSALSGTRGPMSLPAPAFVPRIPAELAQSQFVDAPRLPSNLEITLANRSLLLGEQVMRGRYPHTQLRRYGLRPAARQSLLAQLERLRLLLEQRQPRRRDGYRLTSVSATHATVSAPVVYYARFGGDAPLAGTIELLWRLDADPRLERIVVKLAR